MMVFITLEATFLKLAAYHFDFETPSQAKKYSKLIPCFRQDSELSQFLFLHPTVMSAIQESVESV